jgi:hypothetical protein
MSSTIWHTALYFSHDVVECHMVSAISIALTMCEYSVNLTCSKDDIMSRQRIRQGVMSMAVFTVLHIVVAIVDAWHTLGKETC